MRRKARVGTWAAMLAGFAPLGLLACASSSATGGYTGDAGDVSTIDSAAPGHGDAADAASSSDGASSRRDARSIFGGDAVTDTATSREDGTADAAKDGPSADGHRHPDSGAHDAAHDAKSPGDGPQPDTSVHDSSRPDTGLADSTLPDTGAKDTSTPTDSGTCTTVSVPTGTPTGTTSCAAASTTCGSSGDMSSFTPSAPAPRAMDLSACAAGEITQIFTDCFSAGGTCPEQNGGATGHACYGCLFSNEGDSAWGPLVMDSDSLVTVNSGGCLTLLEPCNAACGAQWEYHFQCYEAACAANCVTEINKNDMTGFNACVTTVNACDPEGCAAYDYGEGCASPIVNDPGAHPGAVCFPNTTDFETAMVAVGAVFCGGS